MLVTTGKAIEELRQLKPIIIFDRQNENEGDIVFSSETIKEEDITFMINHCKGVICLTLQEKIIKNFQIPKLEKKGNNITGQTNFFCPVDHAESHTGISSKDRLMIIKELLREDFQSNNIITPGHQSILKIAEGGLLNRQGHTESSSFIVKEAGFKESAVICEILNNNGAPMRINEILCFSEKFNINVVYLDEIYKYFLKGTEIIPAVKTFKNVYEFLKNKKVIITGTSSGIGKCLEKKLKDNDCEIFVIH